MLTKINENFNFKFHGIFDISEIKNNLLEYSDEWFVDTSRQNQHEVHKETQSVFIFDHDAAWCVGEEYNIMVNKDQQKMVDLVEDIVKKLEYIHDGRVGKCLFIKLPPNKNIGKHTDKLDYLSAVRRHHIPILTNSNVLFTVNEETKNMKVGECWEINNSHFHSVDNNGDTDRIHLLVDIIPNKFIK